MTAELAMPFVRAVVNEVAATIIARRIFAYFD